MKSEKVQFKSDFENMILVFLGLILLSISAYLLYISSKRYHIVYRFDFVNFNVMIEFADKAFYQSNYVKGYASSLMCSLSCFAYLFGKYAQKTKLNDIFFSKMNWSYNYLIWLGIATIGLWGNMTIMLDNLNEWAIVFIVVIFAEIGAINTRRKENNK